MPSLRERKHAFAKNGRQTDRPLRTRFLPVRSSIRGGEDIEHASDILGLRWTQAVGEIGTELRGAARRFRRPAPNNLAANWRAGDPRPFPTTWVLPAPSRRSAPSISPAWTSKDTPASALRSPYRSLRPAGGEPDQDRDGAARSIACRGERRYGVGATLPCIPFDDRMRQSRVRTSRVRGAASSSSTKELKCPLTAFVQNAQIVGFEKDRCMTCWKYPPYVSCATVRGTRRR